MYNINIQIIHKMFLGKDLVKRMEVVRSIEGCGTEFYSTGQRRILVYFKKGC